MKIEVYQQDKKVTDINLSNDHPAEIWLVSPRKILFKPAVLDGAQGDVLHIHEGELIDHKDDRSRH